MKRCFLLSTLAPALLGWAALTGAGVRADPPAAGTVIKHIRFTANTSDGQPSVRRSLLLWAMQTEEGQPYSPDVLARDLDRLFNHSTGMMAADGLIVDTAQSASGFRFDAATGTLTIPIVETHVARVIITGNSKVSTSEILKQVRTHPGDLYDNGLVSLDVGRISNMGLFHTVGPVQVNPSGVGLVDVTIPVAEK